MPEGTCMLKQISVFLENKPGKLAAFAALLSGKGIDIRAMSLAETEDFGIVRLIADDVYGACEALREAGYSAAVKDVLAVQMKDAPGSLAAVLSVLGDNGINLEYMYAFSSHIPGSANMIFKVDKTDKAAAVLTKAGVCMLEQKELAVL